MIRYTITTHEGRGGVTLSCAGQWGSIPYPDDFAASAAAVKHAGDAPFTVARENVRAKRIAR